MKNRRTLFSAIVASLLLVVVLVVALNRTDDTAAAQDGSLESLLAAHFGISLDTLHSLERSALAAEADKAMSSGKISEAQANQIRNLAVSPIIEQAFSDLATATGASQDELFNRVVNGESLLQVAQSHGIQATALKAQIASAARTALQSVQGAGAITSDQSQQAEDSLTDANLDQLINKTLSSMVPDQHR